MRDEAFLHIRSRDGRATRIVPLSGPSVRVGRGRSCEVRLDDPTLAEVEFLLRRRGDAYHLQPVQPASRLTIDGRPADRPRPLPMGTTLRLADRWLTLLPTDDAPDLDGSGLDIEDGPAEGPEAAPPEAVPDPGDPEALDGRREELARWESRLRQRERWLSDRLHERQWEARWRAAGASLKARGRPPVDAPPRPRPSPRPAPMPTPSVAPGPSIRPRKEAGPSPFEPPVSRVERPSPGLSPVSPPTPPPRAGDPPTARPEPVGPGPRADSPAPAPPEAASRALRLTPEVIRPEVERPRFAPPPAAELAETVIEIDPEPTEVDGGPASSDPDPECLMPLAEGGAFGTEEAEDDARNPESAEVDSVPGPQQQEVAAGVEGPGSAGTEEHPGRDEAPPGPVAIGAPIPDIEPYVESGAVDAPAPDLPPTGPDTRAPDVSTGLAPSTDRGVEVETEGGSDDPGSDGRQESAWLSVPMLGLNDLVSFLSRTDRPDPVAGPVDATASIGPVVDEIEPESAGPAGPEGPAVEPAVSPDRVDPEAEGGAVGDSEGTAAGPAGEPPRAVGPGSSSEWPSANAILGSRPAGPRRPSAPRARRAASFPEPTGRISPDEWTIPGGAWLCIPMMFVALAAGVAGVRLAWTWAVLDRESGRIADRLASGKRPEAGSIDLLLERELELPMASWRNSTADAMIARAALLAGPGPGPDPASQERAGSLIHAAGSASPNHPGLRFARAWRAVQEPGVDSPSLAVGLSRDIWPLAWSGRALLAAGKEDEARRAYRGALELACRASPDESRAPSFHGDPQGGRFGMPLEGILGLVVSDMADRPEWSSDDWLGLIPDSSVAWLVASRVLRQRGDGEADRALERAIALADSPAPEGCSGAIHLAAAAEAMALDGRYEEAAEGYRRAVDRLTGAEESARRPWMFNLAELLGRLDDQDGEREALLAAMITDPDDPVTAEAIRAQLRRGVDLVGAGPDGGGVEGDRRDTFGQ